MKHFIDFYFGKAPNQEGVTIEEIFAYSDEELEGRYNFIQRLFPLTTPSSVNPQAPLVTLLKSLTVLFKTSFSERQR